MRLIIDQLSREFSFFLCTQEFLILIEILNSVFPLCVGEKNLAKSQVKELEDALATQVVESKKAADASQRLAAAREKE